MSRNRVLSAVCGVALALAGCGGTNNDQGVSFTHLGYFSTFEGFSSCDSLPTGLLGVVVPLGAISRGNAISNPDFNNQASDFGDGSVKAVVGYRNNLAGQGLIARRVLLSYFIPGASEQPPSSSVPINGVLGPADDLGANGSFDSSLPPAFANTEQCGLASATIVPPAVFRWIVFNQDKLPETPFSMEVTSIIVGTSTSGNTYESNPQTIFVTFTPETSIPATDAAGTTGASTTDASALTTDGSTSDTITGDTADGTIGDTGSTDGSTDTGSDL